MRFPSKFLTFKESSLYKFPFFLEPLEKRDYSVNELYDHVKSKVNGYQEFIEILDCLFVLGKIDLYEEVIHYVKNDQMR